MGARDGEKGRDVTLRETEEYQYHASVPSLLKSLPSRLFSPVPYYRLGKIIFEYLVEGMQPVEYGSDRGLISAVSLFVIFDFETKWICRIHSATSRITVDSRSI